ncbi:hypothetical protein BV898_15787 [Hypsibius exemplaris]|uniref:Protein kinase domain-containing protein n=1 Tax=Hypsibius exemplaris TaxID=2072580 RepID=A0A9X6NC10_HYPEX|nr:hypothetical protein BV898_15787 [Hypsibius exemplaris]
MALHPVPKNLKYVFTENGKKFHCVHLDLLGHGSFGVIKKVNLVRSFTGPSTPVAQLVCQTGGGSSSCSASSRSNLWHYPLHCAVGESQLLHNLFGAQEYLTYILAENGKEFHCVQLPGLLGHGSFGVVMKVNLVQSEKDLTQDSPRSEISPRRLRQ